MMEVFSCRSTFCFSIRAALGTGAPHPGPSPRPCCPVAPWRSCSRTRTSTHPAHERNMASLSGRLKQWRDKLNRNTVRGTKSMVYFCRKKGLRDLFEIVASSVVEPEPEREPKLISSRSRRYEFRLRLLSIYGAKRNVFGSTTLVASWKWHVLQAINFFLTKPNIGTKLNRTASGPCLTKISLSTVSCMEGSGEQCTVIFA